MDGLAWLEYLRASLPWSNSALHDEARLAVFKAGLEVDEEHLAIGSEVYLR